MIGLNDKLKVLEAQGKEVRIGMIGAGQMGIIGRLHLQ
jgi:predicted homoserine dehydrogenase-like protein